MKTFGKSILVALCAVALVAIVLHPDACTSHAPRMAMAFDTGR